MNARKTQENGKGIRHGTRFKVKYLADILLWVGDPCSSVPRLNKRNTLFDQSNLTAHLSCMTV